MSKDKKHIVILEDNDNDLKKIDESLNTKYITHLFKRSTDLFLFLENSNADILVISSGLINDYALSVMVNIRSCKPELPIILLISDTHSSYQIREHYNKFVEATIRKPIDPEELSCLVEKTIKNKSLYDIDFS